MITRDLARKVLEIVDAGLVAGVGDPKPGQMCVEAAVCFALGEPHGDEPSCVDPALRSFKIALNDAPWSSPQARAAGLRRLALAQLGSNGTLDAVDFTSRLALMTTNKIVPRALRVAASMKMPAKHSKALEEAAIRCEQAADLDAASYASYAAGIAASDAASAASYAASYASDAVSAASAASYASDAVSAASAASYASDAVSAASYASDAASYAASAASVAAIDKELSDTSEAVVQILIAMNAPGCQWLDLAPVTEAA